MTVERVDMDFTDVSLGVWADIPKHLLLSDAFIKWYAAELKFDLIALMIDGMDKKWESSWSPQDVEKLLKLLDPYAIEVVLTTWPYPDKKQIDAMAAGMRTLLGVGPVAAWETDQEPNWSARAVNKKDFPAKDGRTPYDLAGDYFVDAKQLVCDDLHTRNEMTTFLGHREASGKADVAQWCDRLLLQLYGVDKRGGKPVSYTGRNGPGRIQVRGLKKAQEIPSVEGRTLEIGVGHAAWFQRFPGVHPHAAMKKSLEATKPYGVRDHRWWSLKHIWGPKANPYAAPFLQSLRNPYIKLG